MTDVDVVIVGGGPNGLMLACELALAGVRPVVLERLPERETEPKANGLVGQVPKLLDHRGLYQRHTGTPAPPAPAAQFMFGGLPLDLRAVPASPLHTMLIPQRTLEALLEDRARELDVDLRRGHELVGFTQEDHEAQGARVDVDVVGPDGAYRLRARYLVGCDGGHSTVRKLAGIGFPGRTADALVSRAGHVSVPDSLLDPRTREMVIPGAGRFPPFMYNRTDRGVFTFAVFQPGVCLMNTLEWDAAPVEENEPMTIGELRASATRVVGADVPVSAPPPGGAYALRRQTARNTRQADRYRVGRVFVAGDAAHVHSGVGGPGLNLGLQDVANLAWKLAGAVHGWAPPGLLDTYHSERHPAGERVVMQTQAQAALLAPGAEVSALRVLFGELLADPGVTGRVAALMAGADLPYDTGAAEPHPLLGRFVPDLPLTGGRATRVAELMRGARPVLLDLTGDPALTEAADGWLDRVDLVTAGCADRPAAALLIRPDGYVAWAGTEREPAHGLRTALEAWFGGRQATGSAGAGAARLTALPR